MQRRFLGIDIGAEALKLVELEGEARRLRWVRRWTGEHHKAPGALLVERLRAWGWEGAAGAAVTGRLGRQAALRRVPVKQAQVLGFRFLGGPSEATLVSIGSHGFSVLELRQGGTQVFRESSRCSQGTGNFLRQLVGRFHLTLEKATDLCAGVADPAPLSGRCPVILKTDMTHLANKGEDPARILAGLFDAVCENVQVLVKPRVSPRRVALLGGVARSPRVRAHFRRFLDRHGMEFLDLDPETALFAEALGAAVLAAEGREPLPALAGVWTRAVRSRLEEVPPLRDSLARVRRLPPPEPPAERSDREVVLGLDIGSTGSKAVAVDAATGEVVWQEYRSTAGNPVGAAQALMACFRDGPAGVFPLRAVGATGSGREIVGSLLTICYGPGSVYVLNEIAAHAEGALSFDPRVDTIFEIGGQDAKYVRLAGGRVVDAAMNEACSAGTGSFIEEQGRKLHGIETVAQLGAVALEAGSGVSLGQHCSVFMAEIIDEAVAAGVDQPAIVAGIYDSIVQNYLNRVKGTRSVGGVVFCQGMPFAADALAAAVARQTGCEVIVPPHPGTIGALGIALLTLRHAELRPEGLEPERFLSARVEGKSTFVCSSDQGCGGAGNKCRIDRLETVVEERRARFTWGGGCSLHDKGTRRRKLPDRAPDPFRERRELVERMVEGLSPPPDRPVVAMTDELQLKGLVPFFATFVHALGFGVRVYTGADPAMLKRGIEDAQVPFCAPMQQFHGLCSAMAGGGADYLFLPMLRDLPRVADEPSSVTCPIVQAAPDVLRWDLGNRAAPALLTPVVEMGPGNLDSPELLESCRRLAAELGVYGSAWRRAHRAASVAHRRFEEKCLALGRRALAFCADRGLTPIVVLGRPYTIHNAVLNSNVPAILREQGAVAIPVDCYPVREDVPVFRDMYWGHGQRNLRAAEQIRRTAGTYGLYCSNYSCGPDSFTLHFFAYLMEGKPYAVIETDGHSGDAGTRTRVEAFLHCVAEDLAAGGTGGAGGRLDAVERDRQRMADVVAGGEHVLIPHMGPGSESLAACLRGIGVPAEALPPVDRHALRVGRRHTSGKECVPMTLTLGSLLNRLEGERETDTRFSLFMPNAAGPCRFGVYNTLHKITLERLGWKDRVRVWTPSAEGYFEGVPPGFATLAFAAFMAVDLLLEGLYDTRPVETRPGAAAEIFARRKAELLAVLERAGRSGLPLPEALLEVSSGSLYGCTEVLAGAARELAAVKGEREIPSVLVVGEIYVRCAPFANDFVIDRLEARGIRSRFAPFYEWVEYCNYINTKEGRHKGLGDKATSLVQRRIQRLAWDAMAGALGWPSRMTVRHCLEAAAPWLREKLEVESVLTLGGPVYEWRRGHIDGVVSVGPLECMPNKIAESQFFHVAETEGLRSLTLSLNGDPVDPEVLDQFAYEIHEDFRRRRDRHAPGSPAAVVPLRCPEAPARDADDEEAGRVGASHR
ncbi:MAG: acyl-CoA dehydratase activase-related protein [Deferrisomatales bacterium]